MLVLRRDLVRGLMLVALPLALFAYLALQSRYFGRWLLPAYPALAMLAAVAVVRVAELLPRRGAGRLAATAALALVVIAQPLLADVRTARVLGREDTLSQARAFLDAHYPPGLRVSIEPAVPGRYFRSNPEGRIPSLAVALPAARRAGPSPAGRTVAAGGRRVCDQYKPGLFVRPDGGVRASAYHAVLGPEVIDDYRLYGYCLVMTVNVVRDRALETGDRARPRLLRAARARVRRWCASSAPTSPAPTRSRSASTSPTTTTRRAYERPGPTVRIYRLRDCEQAYGPPLIRIPKARGAGAVLVAERRPPGPAAVQPNAPSARSE